MSLDPVGILGYGGHAREVTSYAQQAIAFYAVDKTFLKDDLVDIENPSQEQLAQPVVAAIGPPQLRRELVERWPGRKFAKVIAKDSNVPAGTPLGQGVQIGPGAIIMPGCSLGDHVVINIGVTVSHDCSLGDYVTISPGVHIAGNVKMGDGVFVGIGATISDGVTIAPGCVIGAGSVVLEDIKEDNAVVVGIPGKVIKRNEGWLREI